MDSGKAFLIWPLERAHHYDLFLIHYKSQKTLDEMWYEIIEIINKNFAPFNEVKSMFSIQW